LIVIVEKVLHETDTLPSWNSVLGRQRVKPTGREELVVFINAIAGQLNRLVLDVRELGLGATLLRSGALRL
jgi:hypothetical protein